MKKLLLLGSLVLLGAQAYGAVFSTNIVSSHAQRLLGNVYLLNTNRANIYSVQLSSSYPGSISFYDVRSLASPYYGTNKASTTSYVSKTTYATNYVTSYVGSNGFTNWYTNAGFWTLSITNTGFTNSVPTSVFAYDANAISTYNVDLLHVNGISVQTDTNVSLIINYNSGQ